MAKTTHGERAGAAATWTSTQAYVLAVFCLVLGVALGYLFRGSAAPASASVTNPADSTEQGQNQSSPHGNPAQQKAMLDRAAAPLIEALQKNPTDFEADVKLGNLYYDGQQYGEAIRYYESALKLQPENADVRTDLGTSYWYTGNADKAIAEFQKALKVRPDHPGTLFNMGVVKWQGKLDPAGAVAAWKELLRKNPDYPQKQQVEDLITKAEQHAKG